MCSVASRKYNEQPQTKIYEAFKKLNNDFKQIIEKILIIAVSI